MYIAIIINIISFNGEKELIDVSHEFKENIERVWFWIRDAKLLNMISHKPSSPIEVTKGTDTWTLGNEFVGELPFISNYKAICVESESLPFVKKLKWEFHFINLNKVITHSVSLYKDTENDNTVTLWRIELPLPLMDLFKTENINEKIEECKTELYDSLITIEKILKESSINLCQYEGGVIHAPMKAVWELIINPDSIKALYSSLNMIIETNEALHVGGMLKINTSNNNGSYLATITKVDCRPMTHKWVLGFEIFEGKPKIPFQETTITLMKINQQECHLAIFHEFREPTSLELLQSISNKKKLFLEKVKSCVKICK